MRFRPYSLLILMLLILPASCSARTTLTNSTVFDVQFSMVSAGNIPLTEWQIIPSDYENYYGSYIKSYSFRFFHDGSVFFSASYGFRESVGENNLFSEKEFGTYHAASMGPRQKISITLPTRKTELTWEPNPRDPTGSLVFRIWENRIMDFGYVDDEHPAREGVDSYVVLRSESVSPHPL